MVQHVALWQPRRSVPEAFRRQLVDPSCVAPWQPKLLRSTPPGVTCHTVHPLRSSAVARARLLLIGHRRRDVVPIGLWTSRMSRAATAARRSSAGDIRDRLIRTHRRGARSVSAQRRRVDSRRYQRVSTELRMVDESSAPMRRGRCRAGAMSSIQQTFADHDHDTPMRARGSKSAR
jgi:hypothetical protein